MGKSEKSGAPKFNCLDGLVGTIRIQQTRNCLEKNRPAGPQVNRQCWGGFLGPVKRLPRQAAHMSTALNGSNFCSNTSKYCSTEPCRHGMSKRTDQHGLFLPLYGPRIDRMLE